MALFKSQLPEDIIKQLETMGENTEKMMGEMTNAGAKVVDNLIRINMKKVFKTTDRLEKCLKITRVYKTPSDDGINTKVAFYGYLENSPKTKRHPYGTPAPLVAMAREFGSSRGEAKKPFMRKSFKKKEIEDAMLKIEEKYIKND